MNAENAPHSFVALLTEPERQALAELGRQVRVPSGTVLMYDGEPGDRVAVLLAGRVKVTRLVRGRETLLGIHDPGDVLGELSAIDDAVRAATVTSLEEADVLLLPARAFRAHLENHPHIALALLRVLAVRFRDTAAKQSELGGSDTMGRLAARITELLHRYGEPRDGGVEIMLGISQDELAAWVGASRAGVAKALQTFRELGWIETRRRGLFVRDPEGLRARAHL